MAKIPFQLARIIFNEMQSIQHVILKETGKERHFAIQIGDAEALAIYRRAMKRYHQRPLTHDLLKNIFAAFNARIIRVEIVNVQDSIFYGNIVAEADGREINVDSRPSDAIAIAVRAHVPIFVHNTVMDDAGMTPDQDIVETIAPPKREPPAPLSEEASDRLSVFKDFIDKLDMDDPDKDKPASDSTYS